jgi:hypothetical protein
MVYGSTVVKNSFAERDQDDLTCVVGASAAIGREITGMAVALLAPFTPVSCGNAALLEAAGEQERGVAMRNRRVRQLSGARQLVAARSGLPRPRSGLSAARSSTFRSHTRTRFICVLTTRE